MENRLQVSELEYAIFVDVIAWTSTHRLVVCDVVYGERDFSDFSRNVSRPCSGSHTSKVRNIQIGFLCLKLGYVKLGV